MRIETPREKILSNFEVFEHLKEIQIQNNWIKAENNTTNNKKTHKKSHDPDLETITNDVASYLIKNDIEDQNVGLITSLMVDLSKFELEKIEKLQIVNSLPHSLVNLYSIVEECDQRFNEDQSYEILEIINKYFPLKDSKDEDGDIELEE